MNKSTILERLEMLVKLCSETEPDIPSDTQLFTEHSISVQEMYNRVDVSYDSLNTEEKVTIMRESNKIWKLRNKVKNGEWNDLSGAVIDEEIEDYLVEGQKINAIKYYRKEMKERYGKELNLREAKNYVDNIQENMRRRGVIIT